MNKVFHFTLGPVQDFISDARRLRDYWAGSFILSLLSGHAMKVVEEKKNGAVQFPLLYTANGINDDELFAAIKSGDNASSVYIGSLPNRFKADAENLNEDIGEECKAAIEKAWKKICNTIWETYVQNPSKAFHEKNGENNPTKIIWDRQTENSGTWPGPMATAIMMTDHGSTCARTGVS